MIPDEAIVMAIIREWFDKKPHPNRILTRLVLEELLPNSIVWDRVTRRKIAKMVSSRFPDYPTNKENHAWRISAEGFV